ncbi:hypothetical protein [Helicobacter pylori]|uniref:hypothetical protein n=1 Tax=Helicobacter pylori TaxID=210 RepID=UPI00402B1D03
MSMYSLAFGVVKTSSLNSLSFLKKCALSNTFKLSFCFRLSSISLLSMLNSRRSLSLSCKPLVSAV